MALRLPELEPPDPPKRKQTVGKGPIIFFGIAAILLVVIVADIGTPDSSDDPSQTAQSSQESSQSAESASPPTPLARPTRVQMSEDRDALQLSWQPSSGANQYRIQSGTIDEVVRTRSYKFENLEAGRTYRIRVRAEAGDRRSPWTVVRGTTLPPPELPDNITFRINDRYDDISASLLDRVLADLVDWYEHEYNLVAETPSEISVEPQCNPTAYSEALGFARRIIDDAGHSLVEVCVRLDEDNDAAIESEEFKWLLAHEYFHVLQANAGWAFEEPGSIFGSQGECGRHLTEGSAEYFGQLYAWGELQGGGILDTLASLFAGDVERWYYYDDGARAFNALVEWQAHDRATRFWESDEVRCADAFLSAFDVAPGKFETDWQELTAR